MDTSSFRVIIIGGSVAGLVLAHSLHRAGIDHIVLEKATDIAPELGASIGIMPNGAQVLGQLGLYEEIKQCVEPLKIMHMTFPDGFAISSGFPQVLQERFGYPFAFVTRKELLQIVYESYPDKTKVLTGKKIVEVQRRPDGVCAVTSDGDRYEGSIIVGTDGVHSHIRSEIWRAADEDTPGTTSCIKEKSMTVEYACVFGISTGLERIQAGEIVNAFLHGSSIGVLQSKNGQTFWFLNVKLDQKYTYPAVPRFSNDDAAELCRKMKDVRVHEDLMIGDLWGTRKVASMAALEEGLFKTWFYGRVVLLGDSAHKMTPNSGQGENCAIEDAATLASLLHKLVHDNPSHQPSLEQIQNVLQKYQEIRYPRVKRIYDISWVVCRMQSLDNLLYRLVARYVTPWNLDRQSDIAANIMANGEILDFLPLPVHKKPEDATYVPKASSKTLLYTMSFVSAGLVMKGIMWYLRKAPLFFLKRHLCSYYELHL